MSCEGPLVEERTPRQRKLDLAAMYEEWAKEEERKARVMREQAVRLREEADKM